MKLRISLTLDHEVTDLAAYEATTLEEAAANQERWFKEGVGDPMELIAFAEDLQIKVEAVHD